MEKLSYGTEGPVVLTLNPVYLTFFFSQNSVFLSQYFSQNRVFQYGAYNPLFLSFCRRPPTSILQSRIWVKMC